MTTWRLSSDVHLVLTLMAVVTATSWSCATVAVACPQVCQCTQTFYAYCQSLGLISESLLEVVMSVPREAILLDLSSNSLDHVNSGLLDSVPNLQYLFLAENRLHTLGRGVFRYLHDLKELDLQGNMLTVLHRDVFFNISNLKELRIDNNRIETVEAHTFFLPILEQLSLQNNSLTSLGLRQLDGLPSLLLLNLSDNNIHSLEVGVFAHLPSLRVLHLSRNRLSSLAENVFQGLSSLQELHLDSNMLQTVDCFQAPNLASVLRRLYLSNNSLLSVPSDVFPSLHRLQVLALDHNQISNVGPQAFRDLELDSLSLANNYLQEINRNMLAATHRISSLDLSHNLIHAVKTGALDSFRESVYVLDLSGNRLAMLDHGMFRGMRNLQTLNLSSNVLWSILEGSFGELTHLVNLDLDHNQLQGLSAHLLRGLPIERLSVLDNPLREISGFTFENVDHPVSIFVNLTLQSATQTSIRVTWPYRQGAQLYWMLRLWCVSISAGHASCRAPLVESSLPPNKVAETVVSLLPGEEYFVCVDPTFLSPDIEVTQCGRVSTNLHPHTTQKPQEPESRVSNSGMVPAMDWTTMILVVLNIIVVIAHRGCWLAGSQISWTQSKGLPLLEASAVSVR